VDADISASAAIAKSKLAALAIVNADVDAAAAIARSKLNFGSGLVDADIAAGAAIAKTKLASLNIVNADVNASAAIARSKLDFGTGLVNADIASAAAIARSKLDFGSGLVNADIASAAAIAYSKLNLASSIVNADISASAAIAYSKLNLGSSIVGTDLASSIAIPGSPTTTTQATGDNSTKVATTAYVKANIAALTDPTKTFRVPQTFAVAGTLATGVLPGAYQPEAASDTSAIVAIRHKLSAGTATVVVRQNGSTIATLSVTSTGATVTSGFPVSITADDLIDLNVTAVSSAADLVVSLYVEHVVA